MKGKSITKERSKGRKEEREITIYSNTKGIHEKWVGVKSIIKVRRKVLYQGKKTDKNHYFISSLSPAKNTKKIQEGIRNHLGIESYIT